MCGADCGTLQLRRGVWGPLKGAKEGERQEADRAIEFPGKKGRVKVEKGRMPGGGGGGTWIFKGCIRSLSKFKNTPKALLSGQKSTLILIKR